MIDITAKDLEIVKSILQKYVPQCEVRIFGSRINNTARIHSDLDLVIIDKDIIPRETLFDLKDAFDESMLPYRVDI